MNINQDEVAMSLNEMELCLINHIGPMPKYDAESIEKSSMQVSLAGAAAFTRKLLKKTNNLSFFIRFDDVKEYILSNIFDKQVYSSLDFHSFTSNKVHSKNFNGVKEFNAPLQKSVSEVIVELIKKTKDGASFDPDSPFTIECQNTSSSFVIKQKLPEVEVLETEKQRTDRIVSVLNSYFKEWNNALQDYKNLLLTLESLEKSVELKEDVKSSIIEDFFKGKEELSNAKNLVNKITLREYIEKHAKK